MPDLKVTIFFLKENRLKNAFEVKLLLVELLIPNWNRECSGTVKLNNKTIQVQDASDG